MTRPAHTKTAAVEIDFGDLAALGRRGFDRPSIAVLASKPVDAPIRRRRRKVSVAPGAQV